MITCFTKPGLFFFTFSLIVIFFGSAHQAITPSNFKIQDNTLTTTKDFLGKATRSTRQKTVSKTTMTPTTSTQAATQCRTCVETGSKMEAKNISIDYDNGLSSLLKTEAGPVSKLNHMRINNLKVNKAPFNLSLFTLLSNVTQRLQNESVIELEQMIVNEKCPISLNVTSSDAFKDYSVFYVQFLNMSCFEVLSDPFNPKSKHRVPYRVTLSLKNLNLNSLEPLKKLNILSSYDHFYGIDLSYNKIQYLNLSNASQLPVQLRYIDLSFCTQLEFIDPKFFQRFFKLEHLRMNFIPSFGQKFPIFVFSSRILKFGFHKDGQDQERIIDLSLIFSIQPSDTKSFKKCLVEIDIAIRALKIENCDTLELNDRHDLFSPEDLLFHFVIFKMFDVNEVRSVESLMRCLASEHKMLGYNYLYRVELDHIGNLNWDFGQNEPIINSELETLSLYANQLVTIDLRLLPTSLKILDLSRNSLESFALAPNDTQGLASFENFTELRILYLTFNRLKVISSLVLRSTELLLVDISHNQLETLSEINLPPEANKLKINLDFNNLKDLPLFTTSVPIHVTKIEELSMVHQFDGVFSNREAPSKKQEVLVRIGTLNISYNGLHSTNRRFMDFITLLLNADFEPNDDRHLTHIHDTGEEKSSLVVDFIDLSYNSFFIYSICDLKYYFVHRNTVSAPKTRNSQVKIRVFPLQNSKGDILSSGRLFGDGARNCKFQYVVNQLLLPTKNDSKSSKKCHVDVDMGSQALKIENCDTLELNDRHDPSRDDFIKIVDNLNDSCKIDNNQIKPKSNKKHWIFEYCTREPNPSGKNSLKIKFDDRFDFVEEILIPLVFEDYNYVIVVYGVLLFLVCVISWRCSRSKKKVQKVNSEEARLFWEFVKTHEHYKSKLR
jgi:hypothetical protein